MDFSTITVILFVVFLAASVLYYKPQHEKKIAAQICFGIFIGSMGLVLGGYELFYKLVLGKTISQFENMIHGADAWMFNITFFGAWFFLMLHFNGKRIKEWWDNQWKS